MAAQLPPQSGQNIRLLGAFVVTFVVCAIAVLQQLKTGHVDQVLFGALLLVFLGWLGENIADLILTIFGRK